MTCGLAQRRVVFGVKRVVGYGPILLLAAVSSILSGFAIDMTRTTVGAAGNQRGRELQDLIRVVIAEDSVLLREGIALELLSPSTESTGYLLKDRIAESRP